MTLWASWTLTGAYAVGWVASARLLYRYWDDLDTDRGEDRLIAGFLALFWPVAVILAACWLIIWLPTLRCMTPGDRRRRAKMEREQLETRIAELERELGLANGNGKAHG